MLDCSDKGTVTIRQLSLELDTGKVLVWDLTNPSTLDDMANTAFTLKEGSKYRICIRFSVCVCMLCT